MAITVLDATDYISKFCVDVEEWLDNIEDEQRERCLNVSNRTLLREYADLTIPDEAVFEFANVLAILFSDTNKSQFHGVNTFTVNGLGTWDFKGAGVKLPSDINFADYIPRISKDLIAQVNGLPLKNQKVKWTGV